MKPTTLRIPVEVDLDSIAEQRIRQIVREEIDAALTRSATGRHRGLRLARPVEDDPYTWPTAGPQP
jgi:hypothetical protein